MEGRSCWVKCNRNTNGLTISCLAASTLHPQRDVSANKRFNIPLNASAALGA